MSSSHRCDGRCHHARGRKCACWCGGLFHGEQGGRAREAFRAAWGEEIPPDGEPAQLELGNPGKWRAALAAAAAAPRSSGELASFAPAQRARRARLSQSSPS